MFLGLNSNIRNPDTLKVKKYATEKPGKRVSRGSNIILRGSLAGHEKVPQATTRPDVLSS